VSTVRELTDSYVAALTRVPPVGTGICTVCHGVPNPGWSNCYSCDQSMGQVSRPLRRIVPIAIFAPRDQLDTLLASYKNSSNPAVQARGRARIAALFTRFLDAHDECISSDGWNVIAPVPSTRQRPGTHPLRSALALAPRYRAQVNDLLAGGTARTGHNQAHDDGFRVTRDVQGLRVLLADDMFTSGARMQSAASALTLAGATVVAGVVVGRRYYTDGRHADVLREARRRAYRFDTCAIDDDPWNISFTP
jgi:predicted amidophosphoribosyltransferase